MKPKNFYDLPDEKRLDKFILILKYLEKIGLLVVILSIVILVINIINWLL